MNQLKYLKSYARKNIKENDPAHDFNHIMRVYYNAEKICKSEKVNKKLVLSSVLLHDIIKSSKTKNSALKSGQLAKKILKKINYSENEIGIIYDAICFHSFSNGKTPSSLEGKVLQDSDRLDALGAIGLARVFSYSGTNQRLFYDSTDPFSKNRKLNDKKWALDHFYQKLLLLEDKMHTKTGKELAKKRTRILKKFLKDLKNEI
tara:strand:+ start:303 stop:914 length:612 start_codon:yes stop_codon:yes gene_type:complete